MTSSPQRLVRMSSILECPICFDVYTNTNGKCTPVMLGCCGNTICRCCVESIKSEMREPLCPICKQETFMKQDLDSFPVVRQLIRMIEGLCSLCSENAAKEECKHCCTIFCDKCILKHVEKEHGDVAQKLEEHRQRLKERMEAAQKRFAVMVEIFGEKVDQAHDEAAEKVAAVRDVDKVASRETFLVDAVQTQVQTWIDEMNKRLDVTDGAPVTRSASLPVRPLSPRPPIPQPRKLSQPTSKDVHFGPPRSDDRRIGTLQKWVAPHTGTFRFVAGGARGGQAGPNMGGRGALLEADIHLTKGTVVLLVVGRAGGDAYLPPGSKGWAGAGGGGGTFLYTVEGVALLVVGGGGGAVAAHGERADAQWCNGAKGVIATAGTSTQGGLCAGNGGVNGAPGQVGASPNKHRHPGGAGAGWLGAAVPGTSPSYGESGHSRENDWLGGHASGNQPEASGGYGGGGGGGSGCAEDDGSAGGGGGYSGGGADGYNHPGGGGGSYCKEGFRSGQDGGNTRDEGFVRITAC